MNNTCEATIAKLAQVPAEYKKSISSILAKGGLYALGEAYKYGHFECDNIEDLVLQILERAKTGKSIKHCNSLAFSNTLITQNEFSKIKLPGKLNVGLLFYLVKELIINSQLGKAAFTVGKRHYDLGNNLFSAMLDQSMSYTCGYWNNADNLEQAQINKLKLICDKLKLKPGMKILDIGCGWGNFAEYAAKNYDVTVTGITVSEEQAAFARNRCINLPVDIQLISYQQFTGQFDRVVSIEMIEAVGKKNLPFFFSKVRSFLQPNGIAALQAISANSMSWTSSPMLDQYILWLLKNIFPNGYLPNLSELTKVPEQYLQIIDLEDIGINYKYTLNAWEQNFLKAWPTLANHYDENFKRMWLYYLGGCAAFFAAGIGQVFQLVYRREE